jgi:hypothetical protein
MTRGIYVGAPQAPRAAAAWRAVIASLCAVALLLASAGSSFAYSGQVELSKAPRSTPPRDSVTVIGDSVTLGAKLFANMRKRVAKAKGISWCSVDAKGSRQLAAGVELARELKKSGKLGRIVVYSLTTNGSFGYKAAKAAFKAAGKDRYVVFVTGYVKGHSYTDKSNAAVRRLASEQGRVFVADWNKLITGKKNKQLSDNYCHLNATSGSWYVNAVIDAVTEARKVHVDRYRNNLAKKSNISAITKSDICVGDTAQLPAAYWGAHIGGRQLYWESSNPSVLSVSSDGRMKGEALGTAVVTARSGAKPLSSAQLTVNVGSSRTEATGLDVRAEKIGKWAVRLTAVPTPANATGVPVFSSSDSKVARVGRAGMVVGKKEGSATITVRLGNVVKSVGVRVK